MMITMIEPRAHSGAAQGIVMRKTRMTATELARQLGEIHPATIYRLRKLPKAPPLDQVEAWRNFAINNLKSPDAIVKLCR
jgi:hypothetical protein